ncbi:alpha/beta hydrolase [Geomonas agri]|uniref:alpha/beta hydrolase n=1 Tax=Geomonas agri TaxID=2873702 RepID=UPI001CD43B97|nr:alpha/beta hydrolase [Geomonas agri]
MPAAVTPRTPTPPHGFRPRSHRIGTRSLLFVVTLLSLVGCAILNRYILVPKQNLTVTPAQYRIPYQEVWFKTLDDVELNGWFLPGEPGRPLVLLFHGNAGNLSDNLGYLRLLHDSGLPLFIFDYRGFGRSNGEAFKERDFYRDARGALAYLRQQGWSRDRIIFFGQSLGAAVALQMALEGKPAGLVMEGSFTSMEDMVKHVSRLAYFTVGWWGIRLSFDNFHKIARAGVPLLLIHGDRDPVTPVEMSRRLYLRAGAPKMLHIIAGGGHCNAYEVAPASYLTVWQSYLLALPAAATAAAPADRS